MKKLFNMIKFHIKRVATNPAYLGIFFIMPLVMSSLFIFIDMGRNAAPSSSGQATLIVMGQGNESLTEALKKEDFDGNIVEDMEDSLEKLRVGDAGSVYRVPDDYINRLQMGEKPAVELYTRNEKSKSVAFESTFRSVVHNIILKSTLMSNKIMENTDSLDNYFVNKISVIENKQELKSENGTLFTITMLISVYIIMGGAQVSFDLVSLKKNNSLKRAVVSPNSSIAINLALFAAYAIFMLLANFIIFAVGAFIYKASLVMIYRAVLIIVLSMIFSLSLGLVLFRIFKEPQIAMATGMLISIVLIGLSAAGDILRGSLLKNLSYISPMTWMIQILDKGNIFPAAFIILLLSAVLFTSGSYKLEAYVNK